MTLEEALKAQLVGYPGLSSLVAGRVYPITLTENTVLPALTYQRISSPPVLHRGRRSGEPSKTGRPRFQIDGWAASYGQAVALRTQIRAAMAGFARAGAPRIDRTLLRDDRDLRESSNGRFRASIDFELWAEEN